MYNTHKSSMEVVVNFILTNILSVFFIWQAWSTVSKYRAAKTTLQVWNIDKYCHTILIFLFSPGYIQWWWKHSISINNLL